jgi:hypothetical protein
VLLDTQARSPDYNIGSAANPRSSRRPLTFRYIYLAGFTQVLFREGDNDSNSWVQINEAANTDMGTDTTRRMARN